MTKRQQAPAGASDTDVRRLLDQYRCPTPFHAVRTRFLGSVTSPLGASPLDQVKALWGGDLPEFENVAAANEPISALVTLCLRHRAPNPRASLGTRCLNRASVSHV